jgi:hypothetical protein
LAEELLDLEGLQWAGALVPEQPAPLELLFLKHTEDYQPYAGGDPPFDCGNLRQALPDLPPPRLDRAILARLIRHAIADNWGRPESAGSDSCPLVADNAKTLDCSHYIEEFFPRHAGRSILARALRLDITIALDVRGAGGGRWSCRWARGDLIGVSRGLVRDADVIYRTDAATFAAIIQGRQIPQEAFFARRIEIEGELEKGLKLAVLFGHFVREFPYQPPENPEAMDAAALSV